MAAYDGTCLLQTADQGWSMGSSCPAWAAVEAVCLTDLDRFSEYDRSGIWGGAIGKYYCLRPTPFYSIGRVYKCLMVFSS